MPGEETVVVKTTIPRYQKDIWAKHADELGMTQAEFVRTMVQAGRRGFELNPPEPHSSASDPRGNGIKDHVQEVLKGDGSVTYEEIIDSIVEDIEIEVDDYLQWLMDQDQVEFSNRKGYTRNGAHDGDD